MPLGTDTPLDELIHPSLTASLDRFFNGRLDIQDQDEDLARLPDRSLDPSLGWGDRAGLVSLEAAVWPRATAEARGINFTTATATHAAVINQALPQIELTDRAVATQYDGATAVIHNITAILVDSKAQTTRLELERVTN